MDPENGVRMVFSATGGRPVRVVSEAAATAIDEMRAAQKKCEAAQADYDAAYRLVNKAQHTLYEAQHEHRAAQGRVIAELAQAGG